MEFEIPTKEELTAAFAAFDRIKPDSEEHREMLDAYWSHAAYRKAATLAVRTITEDAEESGKVEIAGLFQMAFNVGIWVGMHLGRAEVDRAV